VSKNEFSMIERMWNYRWNGWQNESWSGGRKICSVRFGLLALLHECAYSSVTELLNFSISPTRLFMNGPPCMHIEWRHSELWIYNWIRSNSPFVKPLLLFSILNLLAFVHEEYKNKQEQSSSSLSLSLGCPL